MVCPYCQHPTRVTNSRTQKRANSTWRRRRCQQCHTVFTTIEGIDFSKSLVVETARGSYEPFERDKLLLSIYDSLRHRKTAQTDATALTGTIITQLLRHKTAQLHVTLIANTTYSVLQRFDAAASVHYRAFHPVRPNDT